MAFHTTLTRDLDHPHTQRDHPKALDALGVHNARASLMVRWLPPPWWPRRVHDSDAMAGRVRTDWLGQNTHTQPLTVPNVRPLTRRGLVQHGWRVVRRTSRGARRGHAGGHERHAHARDERVQH